MRPLILWHILGAFFFANTGGGGGQNCFDNRTKQFRKRAEYGFGEYTFFKHQLSELFGPHRVPGRELSEFLSPYYMCVC